VGSGSSQAGPRFASATVVLLATVIGNLVGLGAFRSADARLLSEVEIDSAAEKTHTQRHAISHPLPHSVSHTIATKPGASSCFRDHAARKQQ
jgi:hypothetical protein